MRAAVFWLAAVVLFAFGLFPMANYTSDGQPTPWWNTAVRPWLIWSVIVLGASCAVAFRWSDPIVARLTQDVQRPSSRRFMIGIGLLAFGLAALFAFFCFNGRLVAGDEMALRFQAQVLLSGRLAAVPEQYLAFFNTTETLDTNGRWFSQFPIGGAVPLAIGVALHAAPLVNPLFVGWMTTSMYRACQGVASEAFARWTTILFALSPFVLFMAASQLNHVPALAFILWSVSALPRWITSDDPRVVRRAAIVLGVGIAIAAAIRPYDAALCAIPIGVCQLVAARRDPRRLRSLAWQFGAGVIPIALIAYANWRTTGAPFLFGYDALNGPEHRPGFHLDPRLREHTPLRGIYLASSYLMQANVAVLESPLPVLAFVIVTLILAARRASTDRSLERGTDALALGILFAVLAGYAAYWHEGYYMLGPRFLYSALPAVIWLVARAPVLVRAYATRPLVRRASLLVLPICVLCAWTLPNQMTRHFGVWKVATLNRDLSAPKEPDPVADARAAGIEHALVFVRDSWHGSLAARMRAIGAPPLFTEMFVPLVDACALQTLLDRVPPGVRPPDDIVPRIVQAMQIPGDMKPTDAPPDRRLALLVKRPLTPRCVAELEADKVSGIPIAWLLPFAEFDASGRLGGAIVWARDLGPDNALLKERFKDRAWYRYRVDPTSLRGWFEPIPKP